ncbi:hypothetical protein WICMUC_005172 [Wickerhamomyces mucosus]|uniref:Dilute domain-containing protein n=1 Tax=Wickerhamomyces mucosus TaxID=1378264 RepID=A0A9P8T6X6_9ASCO|nr:hypothetical protein WICMUC_005172 [Wickerhamomyces mucosus]
MDFNNNWDNALNSIGSNGIINLSTDSKYIQLETAKKTLQLLQNTNDNDDDKEQNSLISICLAAANGENSKLKELLSIPENVALLNHKDKSGINPLIYSVVFDNQDSIEIILSKSIDSLNDYDDLFGYTPLMWAVYLGKIGIITELLNHGVDLNSKNKGNNLTVYDLLEKNALVYDYFEQHGLINKSNNIDNDEFYLNGLSNNNNNNNYDNYDDDDELLNKIKLQTIGLNLNNNNNDDDDTNYSDNGQNFYQNNENFNQFTNNSISSSNLLQEEFNFNKLIKNQYIIFSDYDIPSILELIFTLNKDYNHKTTYPAAVIYQCVRYANHIKNNDILVENFLNLTFIKIRSNLTSTKTGHIIINSYKDGDIVLQSYWISVLNFLYYYLLKDDGFFIKYSKIFQELTITLNSLIIELTNSIKFKLIDIIDDCLLNYTNIPEISSTLYQNDWNFFTKRKKSHKYQSNHLNNNYDEIYSMLYPPSIKEQLKPSPIKIVQIFGALLYVLDLHNVHSIITQQTFSIVFNWLSNTLFNRIISQKKLLTRSKAIQIRLNLSILEDWSRSNNRYPKILDNDDSLLRKFPQDYTNKEFYESKIILFKGNSKDILDSSFYHQPLFNILQLNFQPTFQILQWLQCFSSLTDEDSLINIIKNLDKINELQLLKIVNNYRYEIDEIKFNKFLKKKFLQSKDLKFNNLNKLPNIGFYQSNENQQENFIYLNQDYQFPILLPILKELINEYGAGLGGINKDRSLQFQPHLPYQIIDSIDEIHEQKTREINNTVDEDNNINDSNLNDLNDSDINNNKDDGLFKELSIPKSLVHKDWGDQFDENTINPW